MEYILKSSAILTIFYLFYKMFLQRETFFNSIRSYFLTGIISAIVIPFIVITKYIQVDPVAIHTNMGFTEVSTVVPTAAFNWMQLIFFIYFIGVIIFSLRFLWQLSSLAWFLYTHPKSIKGKYILVKTTKKMAPFSFFNYIAYNSNQFDDNELEQILTHEKAHVNQLHSVDIVLSQLLAIVNWFNPFIWLYHREIQKNLEFVADDYTQNDTLGKKNYQYLLLKTISPDFKMPLASHFYNTLIKKRIDMLQKDRSNKSMQFKFALIIPILIVFVFTYNTEIIAQTTKTKEIKKNLEKEEIIEAEKTQETQEIIKVIGYGITEIEQNQLTFIIDKDNSEYDLNKLKTDASKDDVILKIKGVKRNSKGEITAIKIDVSSKQANANYNTSSDDPIKPIKISFDKKGDNIAIGNSTLHHGHGDEIIFVSKDGSHATLKADKVMFISEDGDKAHIKKGIKIDEDGNKSFEIVGYGNKEGEKPLIIIDNKESTKSIEDLDPDDIKSISVLKGESASKKYGNKAKNGVVEIVTKKNKILSISDNDKNPLIIIDGKESKLQVEDLDIDEIESITVLKDEKAIKEYGEKAEDGVIKIITKK